MHTELLVLLLLKVRYQEEDGEIFLLALSRTQSTLCNDIREGGHMVSPTPAPACEPADMLTQASRLTIKCSTARDDQPSVVVVSVTERHKDSDTYKSDENASLQFALEVR